MTTKTFCDHCDGEMACSEPEFLEDHHPKGTPSHFLLTISFNFGKMYGMQHICEACLWHIVHDIADEKIVALEGKPNDVQDS